VKSFTSIVRSFAILLVLFAGLACSAQSNPIALRGTIVTPDEVIENGTVLISGDKIQAVGAGITLPKGVYALDVDGVIYPGLIDLHNHLTWNFLPRWQPNRQFSTRYEWQAIPDYGLALSTPHGRILSEGLACDTNQYAEVKAIVGGATSVVGSLDPSQGPPDQRKCIEGLARNLDFYSGLYPPATGNAEKLRNEVFPLELSEATVVTITKALDNHDLTAFIVHLAEGKPNDPNAAREFRMLRARGFLRPGLSIIHGVALRLADFQELAKAGVGLIWSPRSNIELYGDTTDVRSAKLSNVKIALAPDWSPSGSDGLLQELKYAATWNEGQFPKVFSDAELVQMATSNAAQLAGLQDKIGSIKPGYVADLLIVRRMAKDAYSSLLHASPRDVRLVIIGGSPVYGDEDLMKKLAPAHQLEAMKVCDVPKSLDLESETILQGTRPKPWKQTLEELNRALNEWGLSPAQLTPCPN
jgi:cytosine/adenosine deaminase-related metal-dependent hydrolase